MILQEDDPDPNVRLRHRQPRKSDSRMIRGPAVPAQQPISTGRGPRFPHPVQVGELLQWAHPFCSLRAVHVPGPMSTAADIRSGEVPNPGASGCGGDPVSPRQGGSRRVCSQRVLRANKLISGITAAVVGSSF